MALKDFDYYEFAGIVAPGTVCLYGLVRIMPDLGFVLNEDIGVGDLGLFLVLAYVTGHLLHALGLLIEKLYWWALYNGQPSTWAKTNKRGLLATKQYERLLGQLDALLGLKYTAGELAALSNREWECIYQQDREVSIRNGDQRLVGILLGNYGMFRGMGAAFVVLLIGQVATVCICCEFWIPILLIALFLLAWWRMHWFSQRHASQVLIKFLDAKP
jgi:hypothetical protein